MSDYPRLAQVVLDTTDARRLAFHTVLSPGAYIALGAAIAVAALALISRRSAHAR